MLERIVLKDALQYIRLNHLFDSNQYAFTPGLSTQTALLKFITDTRAAGDKNLATVVLSFDLSNAFDTVDHDRLVRKLSAFRFSSSVRQWFYSYLSGRTQAVRIGNLTSEWLDAPLGVPQGSVLGSFLFSLYMKDLNDIVFHGKIIKYADDVMFYYHLHHLSLEEDRRKIQRDVDSIVRWVNMNGLLLNSGKTCCMVFGSPRTLQLFYASAPTPFISVSSSPIPFASSMKYLGLHLSSSLAWSSHVVAVCSKIYAALSSFAQNRRSLPVSAKIELVSSLVLPHIDYCCLALLGITYDDQLRLQRAFNAAVRFIFNLARDKHVTPYRLRLRWLSIRDRRYYFLAKLMFSIYHDEAPLSIAKFFTKMCDVSSRYETRSSRSLLFVVPSHRTQFFGCSIAVEGSKLWNALPVGIRACDSKTSFEKDVHEYLLNLSKEDDTHASCSNLSIMRS